MEKAPATLSEDVANHNHNFCTTQNQPRVEYAKLMRDVTHD